MWHRARPQAKQGQVPLRQGRPRLLRAPLRPRRPRGKDPPLRLRRQGPGALLPAPDHGRAAGGVRGHARARQGLGGGARRLLRAHVQHGRDGPGLRARRLLLPNGGGAGLQDGKGPPAPAADREVDRDGHARQGAARRHLHRGHAAGAQGRGRRREVLVAHRPLGQVVVAHVLQERSRPRARDAQQAVPAEVRGAGVQGSREGGRRILPEGRPETQVIVLHLAASWDYYVLSESGDAELQPYGTSVTAKS